MVAKRKRARKEKRVQLLKPRMKRNLAKRTR
jgi:hypothetical protein